VVADAGGGGGLFRQPSGNAPCECACRKHYGGTHVKQAGSLKCAGSVGGWLRFDFSQFGMWMRKSCATSSQQVNDRDSQIETEIETGM